LAYHRLRFIAHAESLLPRAIAQLDVFEIERRKNLVESTELQKLRPVEHRRSACGEHRPAGTCVRTWEITSVNAKKAPPKPTHLACADNAPAFQIDHLRMHREQRGIAFT